ncbi:MAG: LCP family protein [Anaerolineae bacterium]|nr:LCP family protein [Anaerolineae bacterium]
MVRLITASLLLAFCAVIAPALAAFAQGDGTPSPLPPTPTYPFHGTYTPPAQPPPLPVPPPVAPLNVDNDAVETILLLGSDSPDNYYRRTDVMILLAIHKDAGTVALWHIPRDLWVYIPNHTMDRINTAYAWGATNEYPGGGFGLLRDLFRYNLGIELDHYARVNFTGFMKIIEALDGLVISVDCALTDWRLKDPTLDPGLEDSWEQYTLGIGRHRLDPYMALWYVRSRQTTTELDRGRRQMDVLRAMWQQMQRMGLLAQIEQLWPLVTGWVDTDMGLTDVLALVPLATTLDPAAIARYSGSAGVHYERVYTPDDGREVFVPVRDNLLPMLEDFLTPPTSNRLSRAQFSVEIADASWYAAGWAHVAANRLAWEGYAARALDGVAPVQRELTVIFDYTGLSKGSPLADLQRLLRVDPAQVIRQPDPNRTVDFRVEIGTEYRACVYGSAEDSLATVDAGLAGIPPEVREAADCWLRFSAEVNVRQGPGLDYAPLDVATPNDFFPVTGRTADRTWWQVSAEGVPAWVSAEITTARAVGECDAVPVVK